MHRRGGARSCSSSKRWVAFIHFIGQKGGSPSSTRSQRSRRARPQAHHCRAACRPRSRDSLRCGSGACVGTDSAAAAGRRAARLAGFLAAALSGGAAAGALDRQAEQDKVEEAEYYLQRLVGVGRQVAGDWAADGAGRAAARQRRGRGQRGCADSAGSRGRTRALTRPPARRGRPLRRPPCCPGKRAPGCPRRPRCARRARARWPAARTRTPAP